MENLVNDLDIKQEDGDANNELYSTKIIASKIYSIAELMDNTAADISQEYRGVHPENSGEEENVYDNLFEVKEEDLDLSSSDNLDTDEDVNVQPTHDSASASISFRVHIAQNHKSNEAKSELPYSLLCLFCGSEFSDHHEWRSHLNAVHKFNKRESLNMLYTNDKISCLECKGEMKSKLISRLQRHRMSHLPYNRYVKCKLCERRFNCPSNHRRHFVKSHNTQKYNNPQKSMKRRKNEDLCNSEANFTLLCPYCGLEFADDFLWRQHLENVHDFIKLDTLNMEFVGDSIKCRDCEKTMRRGIAFLQTHKIRHLPYNLYVKCKLCSKCFQTVRSHKKHINRYHNKKRNDPNMVVLCPFCGKEFPDSNVWRVHLNTIHEFNKRENLNMDLTKDKSKCLECNSEINSKVTWKLQQHRILHLPYKRFVKCKLCEKLFNDIFRYRLHKRRCCAAQH